MPITLLLLLCAFGARFATSQAGELITRRSTKGFDMPQLAAACLQADLLFQGATAAWSLRCLSVNSTL